MPALLAPLLIWILSSAVARVLVALGIGFFTYAGLVDLVQAGLGQVQAMAANFPAAVLQLCGLAGVDEGISIIGSALLTRAAINAAKLTVGLNMS